MDKYDELIKRMRERSLWERVSICWNVSST